MATHWHSQHHHMQSHQHIQLPEGRPSHSCPCHNLGDRAGGHGHCDLLHRYPGYYFDNLSTSGHISHRRSSRYDLPFLGRCEADWWTAVRSSACLVRREKTRVRRWGMDMTGSYPFIIHINCIRRIITA